MATVPQIKVLERAGYAADEVKGLPIREASALIDKVKSYGWKRPTPVMIEAREAKEVEEEVQASRRAVVEPEVADKELDELFGDMSTNEQDDERDLRRELKAAGRSAKDVATLIGGLLGEYKKLCGHGRWSRFLSIIGIPERSAQRYMQMAGVKAELTPGMDRLLEAQGVKLNTHMTSEDRQIAHKAAELADAALEAKSDTVSALYIPTSFLTEEEKKNIAEEAVNAVRTMSVSKANVPTCNPLDTHSISKEDQISTCNRQLDEVLYALRALYGNDERFYMAVQQRLHDLVPEVADAPIPF